MDRAWTVIGGSIDDRRKFVSCSNVNGHSIHCPDFFLNVHQDPLYGHHSIYHYVHSNPCHQYSLRSSPKRIRGSITIPGHTSHVSYDLSTTRPHQKKSTSSLLGMTWTNGRLNIATKVRGPDQSIYIPGPRMKNLSSSSIISQWLPYARPSR